MKVLKCEFANVRKAADVVQDLKFVLEWERAELVIDPEGFPLVRYYFKNEDGEGEQRIRTLLDLDEICTEHGRDEGFDEIFDYVFHEWGRDEKGNWCLGYED